MKRLIFVIVCLTLAFGLFSCSDHSSETEVYPESSSDSAATSAPQIIEEKTEIETESVEVPDIETVTYTNINFSAVYYDPVKTVTEDENGESHEKISFEEQILVENVTLDISFPKDEPVTVLDGVKKILEIKEIFYVEDFSSIVCITDQKERVEDGYFYVWEYEINGLNPSERACNIPLESDMTIVYMLTAEPDKTPPTEYETEGIHGVVL